MNLIVNNLKGKRISLERAFRYFSRGLPGLVLVAIDVASNGVAIVSEHLGWYTCRNIYSDPVHGSQAGLSRCIGRYGCPEKLGCKFGRK